MFLYSLCVILLVTILYSAMVLIDNKRKQLKAIKEGKEILSFDLTPEELYKTLNFLLMYGIIDFEQYTKMELKSLPYVKG